MVGAGGAWGTSSRSRARSAGTNGARGRLQGTFTIGQKQTSLVRSSGHLSAVFHFADGDLYVVGYITFDDSDIDHGAIVGGTGVYAGARGTVDSAAAKDTVHLLP